MSQARVLLVVGAGNTFNGEGLQPVALLSFFDDKGVWLYQGLQEGAQRYRWCSTPATVFDDALLMCALYGGLDPTLTVQAREGFVEDPFAPDAWIDVGDTGVLAPPQAAGLYRKAQQVLGATSGFKLTAMLLESDCMTFGGALPDPRVRDELLRTVDRYGLRNVEICTPWHVRFHGAFDGVAEWCAPE